MSNFSNVDDTDQRQIVKVVGNMAQENKMKEIEKPFQCTECDLLFTTNAARNIHAKSHKVSETYVCKECNFKTNKFLTLRKHRLDECGAQKLKCQKCGIYFPTTTEFKAHMRKGHSSKEQQCVDCDFKTYSKNGLARHRSKKHPAFTCAECDYTCGCKNQIKKHIADNHISETEDSGPLEDPRNDVFTCPFCEYLDSDPYNMEKHIQEIHELNKPFPCTECDQDFYDDVELELHIMTEHEEVSCSQCDYKGPTNTFEIHMQTHGTVVKSTDGLSCTLCDFISTSDDDLEDHIYEFHTKGVGHTNPVSHFDIEKGDIISKRGRKIKPKKWFDESDNVTRDNIEGELKNQSIVSKDQLFIRQGIEYKCPICGEYFVNKQGLKTHMNFKHEHYECEECNTTFKTSTGLNNHIDDAHSLTQIMYCAKCDYTCSTEMDLSGHISIHTPVEGLNIHKDSPDLDTQVKGESLQDPGCFIAEKNVCGAEIEGDQDYIENSEYETDPTSPDDSLCIDNSENVDDDTNIVGCTEHTEVIEAIDESEPIISEINKSKRKENNILEESRKNCDFEDLFHNEITYPEVSVGQNNDYVEEDDEDDLGVEGDYIGDMYEDEEIAEDDNIQNETTEYTCSVLNKEYTKGEEFDRVRKPVNDIGDRTKEINANNAHDVEGTKTDGKVKDSEPVCIMKKNASIPNVKLDVLGLDFDRDDELELQKDYERNMNMAGPSRYIDERYLENSKKRKSDEYLENPDIKKETKMNEDKEKIFTADKDMEILYGCSECDYVGPKQEFQVHIRQHGMNKHFNCKICEYRCYSKIELNAHITRNHTALEHFACTECDFTSPSTTGIKIHKRLHFRNELLCGQCKYECFSLAALKEHHQNNHKGPVKVIKLSKENNKMRNRKLNPKYTSEEFYSSNKESYVKRIKKESGEAIIISKNISRRKIVAIPYMAGPPKSSIKLDISPSDNKQNAFWNEEYDTSVSKLDGINQKKIKRKFVAMPKVQNTMKLEYFNEFDAPGSEIHEHRYQCNYCIFVSINRRGLSVHMRGMHGLKNSTIQYPKDTWIDTKQYACELCNYKASSNDKVAQHFRTHIGERPWTCQECGAKFTTKNARMIHEACHLEEKKFKCKYDGCNYATTLKLNLSNHYYYHTFKEKKNRIKEEKQNEI